MLFGSLLYILYNRFRDVGKTDESMNEKHINSREETPIRTKYTRAIHLRAS